MPSTGPDSGRKVVHVVAGALLNGNGEVLLARRHRAAHQGGLWEFPGGKLEAEEAVTQGLQRELQEEIGIDILEHRPLIRVRHAYPDREVLLDVHSVSAWDGEPHGREDQPLAWVPIDELSAYPMPPADGPIVSALKLPSDYLITPPQIDNQGGFLDALSRSVCSGSMLQLRLFDLSPSKLMALGRAVCQRAHAQGARVLLNGTPRDAVDMGADGVHLNSRRLAETTERPLGEGQFVAASCHSLEELRRAESIGCDFAVLSPVLPTRSHPDAEPLGWERFALWADRVNLPVFALGGMSVTQREVAWRHGAQGIAGIRGLWN
jgi:8-oxo-dGTP diphosphatase